MSIHWKNIAANDVSLEKTQPPAPRAKASSRTGILSMSVSPIDDDMDDAIMNSLQGSRESQACHVNTYASSNGDLTGTF